MESLKKKLIECGQEHLLKFYDELSDKEKEELCQEISELNFMDVISYFDSAIYGSLNMNTLDDKVSPIPKENIASVKTTDKEQLKMYEELGLQEIANGQVAVLLMAGGQGTRLGVTYPKGMYNVGLPSGKTLFQLQAERILRLENMAKEKYGKDGEITWYILTSEATHDITVSFLHQHNYFNLKEKNCKAFKQDMLPCFTLDGKIILDKKYKISKAPDGNGGVYRALITQGILDDMTQRGIHSVHVHSVDNILIKVADPIFIGYCLSLQTDCGVKVIQKCSPNEPVGIVCKVNDIFKVVEYSEISKETAELYTNDGQLMYNAANICNHYFTVDFLYSIAKYHEKEIELHAAKKKIPYIDEDGNRNEPKIPNGIKIEKFIFDVFKFAKHLTVWEGIREEDFSPLKNADSVGQDCPSTARNDVLKLHKKWLLNAGAISVSDNCHLNNDKCEKTSTNIIEINCIQNLKKEIDKLFANIRCNLGSVEYTNLNKMLANCYLKTGNELEAIFHLIESHAVILRQQILHRCIKTEMRKSILNVQQAYGLKSSYVGFNINNKNKIENIKTILFDLPKEWYMIQITGQYKSPDIFTYTRNKSDTMHEIYITVLPTGIKEVEPLCLVLPKPNLHSSYDICYEIQKLLSNNRSELETTYANNELYWKMRERQNANMKTAMHALEHIWLREWRILFMADPINKQNLVTDIVQMIDKLISDHKTSKVISKRSKWLLKKIALAACFLTKEEIARAVKYVLSDYDKLADSVILSIFGKLPCMQELKNATRKTLVLIIDEHMDYIPFESMEILKFHPITRFPSLHIAYALFKEHENTMENGCKIIRVKDDIGTCIVNPSGNLSKMEKRMRLFIEYWLPNWRSWYNIEPQEEVFEDSLINRDILMYNGHGNGIQYLPGEQIERLRVKSIVLLFGCSSVKLLNVGGRYPPYGISNQYLIASSPCVLGMLWEVTDADTDKMTTNFISNWIPSPLNRPWTDVDINMWCLGILS